MCKHFTSWRDARTLISLVLLIASAASAARALPMKACELLTVKDMETVLGAGYTPKEILDNQIMSACAYTKGKGDAVTITLKQEFQSADQILKMEQEGIKQRGGQISAVSGLGDNAYYLLDSGKNIFLLNFGKGNLRVIVSVDSGGKPNIDAAMKLAKIAYPRLR
jgi:hypothetical protein